MIHEISYDLVQDMRWEGGWGKAGEEIGRRRGIRERSDLDAKEKPSIYHLQLLPLRVHSSALQHLSLQSPDVFHTGLEDLTFILSKVSDEVVIGVVRLGQQRRQLFDPIVDVEATPPLD